MNEDSPLVAAITIAAMLIVVFLILIPTCAGFNKAACDAPAFDDGISNSWRPDR